MIKVCGEVYPGSPSNSSPSLVSGVSCGEFERSVATKAIMISVFPNPIGSATMPP